MSTCTAHSCSTKAQKPLRFSDTSLAIRSPLRWLLDRIALRRQRLQLSELDARQLRDIGLTAEQARAEAARPIWDAPSHWLR